MTYGSAGTWFIHIPISISPGIATWRERRCLQSGGLSIATGSDWLHSESGKSGLIPSLSNIFELFFLPPPSAGTELSEAFAVRSSCLPCGSLALHSQVRGAGTSLLCDCTAGVSGQHYRWHHLPVSREFLLLYLD